MLPIIVETFFLRIFLIKAKNIIQGNAQGVLKKHQYPNTKNKAATKTQPAKRKRNNRYTI